MSRPQCPSVCRMSTLLLGHMSDDCLNISDSHKNLRQFHSPHCRQLPSQSTWWSRCIRTEQHVPMFVQTSLRIQTSPHVQAPDDKELRSAAKDH